MRHFLYAVSSVDPAPVGDGDAASWLQHYKLRNPDDVFIPMASGLEDIQAGDMLWFAVNNILEGVVTVSRIEEDVVNDRKEIWFDGSQIHAMDEKLTTHLRTAIIGKETTDRWFKSLKAL